MKAKRSKKEEINRKNAKNKLKNKEIGAYFELETRFQALQNTVILKSKVYISKKASNENHFYKNQITSKKLGHFDEKTAKNGYHSVKN